MPHSQANKLEECDITAASLHAITTAITQIFFNPSFFLLSLLQRGRIPAVTIGNHQHPSIRWHAFIRGVHCCSWSSRGQRSHTDPPGSFFYLSLLLSPASSSPSSFPVSWLHHSFFLSLLPPPPPSLLLFYSAHLLFSFRLSLFLLFTLMLKGIKLHSNVKEPGWNTMTQ